MLRIKSLSAYNSSYTSSPFTAFSKFLLKSLLFLALAFFLSLFIFSQDIFAAQIRLAWDPNTESDLAGYKVYYGTTSGTYGTPIDAGNVTTYTLTGLTLAQTYFISVTAYDTSINESGYSNEVSGLATDGTQTSTTTNNSSGVQVVIDGITYTETISTPAIPSFTTSGNVGISYTYIASGAASNLGHSLEYQFDWKGDGTDLSFWGAANQQKIWTTAGTYDVRVRARCSTHTSAISNWSSSLSLQVTIQGVYQISCSDSGIQCLERADGGSDGNNLVNGKPKVDVEFNFQITVQDAGGTPQYVKIFSTQRNNPAAGDFYGYDMTCSGNYPAGASCTHRTVLGPAAVHKFYFQVKMSNGSEITYPSTGYITGPEIQLLNGNNLVGVPRNIASAQLSGQEAFGTSRVYRWNAEQNLYTEVSSSQPVKPGEGYSLYRENKSLPQFSSYTEVLGIEYTYPLNPGLNLVSNPYSGNVRLSDIRIQKGSGTPVTWQEAVARGWILDVLYYYNGKDWGNTYSYLTSENGGVLVPWLGYWVDMDATDALYYLVVTKP